MEACECKLSLSVSFHSCFLQGICLLFCPISGRGSPALHKTIALICLIPFSPLCFSVLFHHLLVIHSRFFMKNIQVFILYTSFWLCLTSKLLHSFPVIDKLLEVDVFFMLLLHWLLLPVVRIALGYPRWLNIPTLFFLILYFSFLLNIYFFLYFYHSVLPRQSSEV